MQCNGATAEGTSPAYDGVSECSTEKVDRSMLVDNTFVVYSQQISQFFDPDDYLDYGALMFMSQNLQVQNLIEQNKENIQ